MEELDAWMFRNRLLSRLNCFFRNFCGSEIKAVFTLLFISVLKLFGFFKKGKGYLLFKEEPCSQAQLSMAPWSVLELIPQELYPVVFVVRTLV